MKWDMKDQAIFECADKGLLGLKRFGWLTLQEYEEIQQVIRKAIEEKEELHNPKLAKALKKRSVGV